MIWYTLYFNYDCINSITLSTLFHNSFCASLFAPSNDRPSTQQKAQYRALLTTSKAHTLYPPTSKGK